MKTPQLGYSLLVVSNLYLHRKVFIQDAIIATIRESLPTPKTKIAMGTKNFLSETTEGEVDQYFQQDTANEEVYDKDAKIEAEKEKDFEQDEQHKKVEEEKEKSGVKQHFDAAERFLSGQRNTKTLSERKVTTSIVSTERKRKTKLGFLPEGSSADESSFLQASSSGDNENSDTTNTPSSSLPSQFPLVSGYPSSEYPSESPEIPTVSLSPSSSKRFVPSSKNNVDSSSVTDKALIETEDLSTRRNSLQRNNRNNNNFILQSLEQIVASIMVSLFGGLPFENPVETVTEILPDTDELDLPNIDTVTEILPDTDEINLPNVDAVIEILPDADEINLPNVDTVIEIIPDIDEINLPNVETVTEILPDTDELDLPNLPDTDELDLPNVETVTEILPDTEELDLPDIGSNNNFIVQGFQKIITSIMDSLFSDCESESEPSSSPSYQSSTSADIDSSSSDNTGSDVIIDDFFLDDDSSKGQDSSLSDDDFSSSLPANYNEVETQSLMNQCEEYKVIVTTDIFPYETFWELEYTDDGTLIDSVDEGEYTDYYYEYVREGCLDPGRCIIFKIYDSWGDGIFSPGGYTVMVNNIVMAEGGGSNGFDSYETKEFCLSSLEPTSSHKPTSSFQPSMSPSISNLPSISIQPSFVQPPVSDYKIWLDGLSWNGNKWLDKSTNDHDSETHGTINTAVDSESGMTYLYGDTYSGVTLTNGWPSGSEYTFFHVTKYNGANKYRIWNGITGNWWSGHHGGRRGTFYHYGWVSQYEGGGKGPNVGDVDSWGIFTDRVNSSGSNVRVDGVDLTINSSPDYNPDGIGINPISPQYAEPSDWAAGMVLVYDRYLTDDEVKSVEDWIYAKYIPNLTPSESPSSMPSVSSMPTSTHSESPSSMPSGSSMPTGLMADPYAQVDFSQGDDCPTCTPYSLHDGAEIKTAPGGTQALRIDSYGPYAKIPGVDISPSNMPECTLTIGLYLESITEEAYGYVFNNEESGWDRGISLHDPRSHIPGKNLISSTLGYSTWKPWADDNLETGTAPVKEWFHVTAVFRQGGDCFVYVNGIKSDYSAIGNNNDGLPYLVVGRKLDRPNHWADAWIKEVKVFDQALSDAHVQYESDNFFGITRTDTVGGSGGIPFNDWHEPWKYGKITQIEVNYGSWVDFIKIIYANDQSFSHGKKSSENTDIIINLNGYQYIDKVSGRQADGENDAGGIRQMTLETNDGVIYGPYGTTDNGETFVLDFEGNILLHLFGMTISDGRILQLGFVTIDPSTIPSLQPSGNPTNTPKPTISERPSVIPSASHSIFPSSNPTVSTSPSEYCDKYKVVVTTDIYPSETSWELKYTDDGTLIDSINRWDYTQQNTEYVHEGCIDLGRCTIFKIYDSYGDGIFSPGGYTVMVNNIVMAEGGGSNGFDSSETKEFCTSLQPTSSPLLFNAQPSVSPSISNIPSVSIQPSTKPSTRPSLSTSPSLSGVTRMGPVGENEEGYVFDDKHPLWKYGRIVKIELYADATYVDFISITYETGESFEHGTTNGDKHIITLNEGMYITKVSGRIGNWVHQLKFETNDGREFGPYGYSESYWYTPFEFSFGGNALVYIFGRDTPWLYQLGFAYADPGSIYPSSFPSSMPSIFVLKSFAQIDFSQGDDCSTCTPYTLYNRAEIKTAPGGFQALRIDSNGPYAKLPGINIGSLKMSECTLTIGLYLEKIPLDGKGWVFGNNDRIIILHDLEQNNVITSAVGEQDGWMPWANEERGTPPIKKWFHVTAVFRQEGECAVYVNGVKSDNTAIGNNAEGLPDLYVGRPSERNEHWSDAWIKDVKVFDRALSDDEVQSESENFLLSTIKPHAQVDFSQGGDCPTCTPYSLEGGAEIKTAPGGKQALRIENNREYAKITGIDISPSKMPNCTLTIGVYLESIPDEDARGWIFGHEESSGYDRTIILHDTRDHRFSGKNVVTSAVGKVDGWMPWVNEDAGAPPTKEWFHVTAVFRQGGDCFVYVNGVKSTFKTTGQNDEGLPDLYVGGSLNRKKNWADAWIKEVKVFNRALSDDQVQYESDSFFDITRTETVGGSDGDPFDDRHAPWKYGVIQKIEIFSDSSGLNYISITYANGQSLKHGTTSGRRDIINLEENQYIVEVSGRSDNNAVRQITFKTNDGQTNGPYGDSTDGEPFQFDFDGDALLHIFGRTKSNGGEILQLGFAYINSSLLPSSMPSSSPSSQPSMILSAMPSLYPSSQPSSTPSVSPSSRPSLIPSLYPSSFPSTQPSVSPSLRPSLMPSLYPSSFPSTQPSVQPSTQPSSNPSVSPSSRPSLMPSLNPSSFPSMSPSVQPSIQPSSKPSISPSSKPSLIPSLYPSSFPSTQPSVSPSLRPSLMPSLYPSSFPSTQPSVSPSLRPSLMPSLYPSSFPSTQPSVQPSTQPSSTPSVSPSSRPSLIPSLYPSSHPSVQPSKIPTSSPSEIPSSFPSTQDSKIPSVSPTALPSKELSYSPSIFPTVFPSDKPSKTPSVFPSVIPSDKPSIVPSKIPSIRPSVFQSDKPSIVQSIVPSVYPSMFPSDQPSKSPSLYPSFSPSYQPSKSPTEYPSMFPSDQPSSFPSRTPSISPSIFPSDQPTSIPSKTPSVSPSVYPSIQPTSNPSTTPSLIPSVFPSIQPSSIPSSIPSIFPSTFPSISPSITISESPSFHPTQPYDDDDNAFNITEDISDKYVPSENTDVDPFETTCVLVRTEILICDDDPTFTCSTFASQGWCTHKDYEEIMTERCKKSCDNCPSPIISDFSQEKRQPNSNDFITNFNLDLSVNTDANSFETSWVFLSENNKDIIIRSNESDTTSQLLANTLHNLKYSCVVSYTEEKDTNPDSIGPFCYNLEVHDSFGDGMCCDNGPGYFSMSVNNTKNETLDISNPFYEGKKIEISFCIDDDDNIESDTESMDVTADQPSYYPLKTIQCKNRKTCICDSKPNIFTDVEKSDVLYDIKSQTLLGVTMLSQSIKVQDVESPQYKAACWVLFDDPYRYVVSTGPKEGSQKRMLQQYRTATDTFIEEGAQKRMMQRYTLAVLYFSTSPKNWVKQYKFLSRNSECEWNKGSNKDGAFSIQGSICDEDGNIVSMYLKNNNLDGTIIEELSELKMLEILDLSNNKIQGSIPPMFGQMSQLRGLYLSKNQLEGSIHPHIFDAKRLEIIELSGNKISETIPDTIAYLRQLSSLNLNGNEISGSIPDAMYSLMNLQTLNLGTNKFSSSISPEIGNLKQLKTLNMGGNILDGQIPPTVGELTELHELSLGRNTLTGPIPSSMGELSSLTELALDENQLTGEIPESLFSLSSLRNLKLQDNAVSGSIPDQFCEIDDLDFQADCQNDIFEPQVSCSCCSVCNDKTPTWEGECPDATMKIVIERNTIEYDGYSYTSGGLEWSVTNDVTKMKIPLSPLSPEDGDLGGIACVAYSDCISIDMISPPIFNTVYRIHLNNELVDDSIRMFPGSLQKQEGSSLEFKNDPFQFDIESQELVSCRDIELLCDRGNGKYEKIPIERNSEMITSVSKVLSMFGSQNIQDPTSDLSKALCWLVNDKTDSNGNRRLSETVENHDPKKNRGLLDTEILQRYVLTMLHFSSTYNLFGEDDYPPEKHECEWPGIQCTQINGTSIVTGISLSSNDGQIINGTLIDELGGLQFLETLEMNRTQLSGTIPETFSNLWSLKKLDLSENELNGTLPVNMFRQLNKLEHINLSNNLFSRNINEDIGSFSHIRVLSMRNNSLTGSLPLEGFKFNDLEYLDVSGNQLNSVEFDHLTKHTNLKSLDLSFNFFVGSLNEDMFTSLFRLEYLNISQNDFSGTIPSTFPELSNITHIDMHANRFRGVIPGGLTDLSYIQYINLQGNKLTGSLPSQLNQLKHLDTLVLSHNEIKGDIPFDPITLKNLDKLHLHGNSLVGRAPEFKNLTSYITDCGYPSASKKPIACPTCNTCCNADGNCQDKGSKDYSQVDLTIMFICSIIGVLTICYMMKHYITHNKYLETFFCETVGLWNAMKLISDKSVYHFLLAKNKLLWFIAVACVVFQGATLFLFVQSADIANETSDREYTMICPANSLDCENSNKVSKYGYFVFGLILIVWLMKDIVGSFKLMLVSFQQRNIDFFFAGAAVFTVTMLSLWSSIVYIIAIAVKNTDLIKDAVVLLFVIEIDERIYELVENINPEWVEDIEKDMRNSFVYVGTNLIIGTVVEDATTSMRRARRKMRRSFRRVVRKVLKKKRRNNRDSDDEIVVSAEAVDAVAPRELRP